MGTVLSHGGPLMWLLLASSVLAVAIFLERLLHYHRAQIHAADFVRGILNTLKRGNIAEATATCDETAGPVAEVVKAAVAARHGSPAEIREAVEDVAREEIARLEAHLPWLATIAQVAPLIGFLGTTVGLIKVFMRIQAAPLPNPGDLAAGIWMALLTTAGGLAVAIPTYVAYNYLVTRVQDIVRDMERASSEVVRYLCQQQQAAQSGHTGAEAASRGSQPAVAP